MSLKKIFSKLMNNAIFGKTMENVRKQRYWVVTTNKRRSYLVSEANYHTATWFSEILLAIEMKEIKVKMNKPVDLRLSVLQISKTLICELWYDFIKPNYQQNEKLCYIDTDSFIIYIKTEDVYEDIANDVEKRFDTSNYEVNRSLPKGKNERWTRWKNDDRFCRG